MTDQLRDGVIEYCTQMGVDPLLVQGAGGNVSWKDEDILWVKASGTWLADADKKDIFVPIDLAHLRKALNSGDFSITPILSGASLLRPSIETLLHALMPHRVVIHLHAIEALAHLVRENCQNDFQSLLGESVPWTIVDYHKPGAALAAAISAALAQKPIAQIIFLKNHGMVIGGESITDVRRIINTVLQALSTEPEKKCAGSFDSDPMPPYAPVADLDIHQLALNKDFFKRLNSDWALYPDHVVFLGPKAYSYSTWQTLNDEKKKGHALPELVFIQDAGVYATSSFNEAKLMQLRCYYDVIARQKPNSLIKALTESQISELLNWDAEHYRMNIAK